MHFDEEYFRDFEYSLRERLIKRHILEVLKWGSKVSNSNLLDGQGKTALDVGCAYGYAVNILESFGYDAYGVDISKYSIKQAKENHAAHFTVCDVEKGLPFKKEIFDLVTCFEVLEHLKNPLQAIKNMFASCKNTMICTTPNRAVEKPIKRVLRDFDKTHIAVKTPWEWKKYLHENLQFNFVKVESFFDTSLRVADKLLFFKSLKVPYLGLDVRILIKRQRREAYGTSRCSNAYKKQ